MVGMGFDATYKKKNSMVEATFIRELLIFNRWPRHDQTALDFLQFLIHHTFNIFLLSVIF